MVQGKPVPESTHWIIIRLSSTMSHEDVAMYTDVSVRKVKEIITYFKRTGDIDVPKRLRPQLHRALCDYDVQVSHNILFYSLVRSYHCDAN
jgi:hypothetical protein